MKKRFLILLFTQCIMSVGFTQNYEKFEFDKIEPLIKRLYLDLYGKTENNNLLISILKNTPNQITFNNKIIL